MKDLTEYVQEEAELSQVTETRTLLRTLKPLSDPEPLFVSGEELAAERAD